MPTKYKCVTLGNFKDLGIYPLYFPIEISSTSYLYNFLVKKRKSNTKVKLFDINWQVKGQTKITNYVPRTTSVVPPLYYDCFGFIVYFTKKTRKILELLTDSYLCWERGEGSRFCPWPFFCLGFWGSTTLLYFLPFSLCQQEGSSILRD